MSTPSEIVEAAIRLQITFAEMAGYKPAGLRIGHVEDGLLCKAWKAEYRVYPGDPAPPPDDAGVEPPTTLDGARFLGLPVTVWDFTGIDLIVRRGDGLENRL